MHLFALGLMDVMDLFKLINSLYCCSLFLLCGNALTDAKAIAKVNLKSKLDGNCMHGAADPEAVRYTKCFMRLVDCDANGPTREPSDLFNKHWLVGEVLWGKRHSRSMSTPSWSKRARSK